MNIQLSRSLLPEGDTTGETILPIIKRIVKSALSFVDLAEEGLENFTITDTAEFGLTIHKLQEEAGHAPSYTDNKMHKAVAKTIAKHQGNRVTNSIVIRDDIVEQVIMGAQLGNDIDNWDEESQFCFYIFTHEVGHCKDNILRPDPEEIPLRVNNEFKVQQIAKYYFSVLMGEFAACVHSADAMTEGVHQRVIKEWRRDTEEILGHIKKSALDYQRDNNKLFDLADCTSQGFWVIILQYAKIIGSMIGNPNLDQTQPSWVVSNPEIERLLSDMTAALRNMWNEYPSWNINSSEKLLALWKALALAHGYRFEENAKMDGLFLDIRMIYGK